MDYRNRLRITIGLAVGALTMAQAADGAAQTPPSPLIGGWTINKDLSSQPADGNDEANARRDRDRAGDRRGGGGGGGFRGGFGGGRRGGGGGRGAEAVDPDAIARMRDALRDLTNPPAHLVIVQTDSMIILTGPDGRTMRLSPDGKKIKDESTKTERKTKWDGGKLVSEISGLPGMKITQTFSVDPERRQLRVTVQSDNDRRPLMLTHVYDADAAGR